MWFRERSDQARLSAERERQEQRTELEREACEAEVTRRQDALQELESLADVDLLLGIEPREFERIVVRYFELMGYEAQIGKGTSDGGVDGIAVKDGKTLVIQCKRYQGSVGEPPVRDLLGVVTRMTG